jgi:hypothetical protein
METYIINRRKIEQLIRSFETTSVWPVLIARKVNGSVELAFGHHRKAAIEERYGGNFEIDVILQNLSDEDMLKYMASENQHDFATPFITEMETVHAVVLAFAAGKIKLEEPAAKGAPVRIAPSFIPVSRKSPSFLNSPQFAYNAKTVAVFLGWIDSEGNADDKVNAAINALQLRDENILSLPQLEDLPVDSCRRIIRAGCSVRDNLADALQKAEEYAERIEADYQKVKGTPQEKKIAYLHNLSQNEAKAATEKLKSEPPAAVARAVEWERNRKRQDREIEEVARVPLIKPNLPDLNTATETLRRKIEHVLTSHDELGKRLAEVTEFKDQVDFQVLRFLALALGRLCRRSEKAVRALGMTKRQLDNSEKLLKA